MSNISYEKMLVKAAYGVYKTDPKDITDYKINCLKKLVKVSEVLLNGQVNTVITVDELHVDVKHISCLVAGIMQAICYTGLTTTQTIEQGHFKLLYTLTVPCDKQMLIKLLKLRNFI